MALQAIIITTDGTKHQNKSGKYLFINLNRLKRLDVLSESWGPLYVFFYEDMQQDCMGTPFI